MRATYIDSRHTHHHQARSILKFIKWKMAEILVIKIIISRALESIQWDSVNRKRSLHQLLDVIKVTDPAKWRERNRLCGRQSRLWWGPTRRRWWAMSWWRSGRNPADSRLIEVEWAGLIETGRRPISIALRCGRTASWIDGDRRRLTNGRSTCFCTSNDSSIPKIGNI